MTRTRKAHSRDPDYAKQTEGLKEMPVRAYRELSGDDRKIVETFIRFANHKPFTTEDQVNAVFRSVDRHWAQRDWVQRVPLRNIDADRETARSWLATMMTQKDVTSVVGEINERLGRYVAMARPQLDPRTEKGSYPQRIPLGVEGWIALGAFLVFDSGLRHRIRRCRYSGNREIGEP